MTRAELSDDKKKQYDAIVERMMREIEEQNPEQYSKKNQLDGKATDIYISVTEKYLPELEKLLK